jgi:hypothetical protein
MCVDFTETNLTKFTGFKVVAVKNDVFYSVLTGEEYPIGEDMPVWKSQKEQIINYFSKNFLSTESKMLYRKQMEGRTSVFVHQEHAEDLLRKMHFFRTDGSFDMGIVCHQKKDFELVIAQVQLEQKIATAQYLSGHSMFPVVVGKRIASMKVLDK